MKRERCDQIKAGGTKVSPSMNDGQPVLRAGRPHRVAGAIGTSPPVYAHPRYVTALRKSGNKAPFTDAATRMLNAPDPFQEKTFSRVDLWLTESFGGTARVAL